MAAVKQHQKLAKFLNYADKKLGLSETVVTPSFSMECINTGSTVLNMLIGGTRMKDGSMVCPGWPRGRISEIFGRESSGKSTIALMAMGQVSAMGGTGLYIDLEHAVVDTYAAKLGVDFRPVEMGGAGNMVRCAPTCAEEVEVLVNAAALHGFDFIVIDSVAGLQVRKEIQRDVNDVKDKKQIAETPRFMSDWMPKLQAIIAKTGTHVMFLNQQRDKIGAIGYTEEALKSTTGGNALKFWASIRMILKPKEATKAKRFNVLTKQMDEVPIATNVEVKNVKNKIDAKQGHSGMVTLRYGIGIDEMRTLLNVGTAYGVVKMTKNAKKQEVYTFTNSSGVVIEKIGVEKFRQALQQDGKSFEEYKNLCIDKINEGMKAISDEEVSALAEGAITSSVETDDDGDLDFSDGPPQEVPAEHFGVDVDQLIAEIDR